MEENMKRIAKKIAVATLTTAFVAMSATAQEADDAFDGGEDSFSGFEDESSGGGDDFDFDSDSSSPSLSWNGQVDADARLWIGGEDSGKHNTRAWSSPNDISKSSVDADAKLKLDLSYKGANTDAKATLKIDAATIKEHPEDVLSEASVGGSFFDGVLELRAGKMIKPWGKCDKVHVLDNFNANDYTDFIFPDYLDRRLGEIMFSAKIEPPLPCITELEGIYTPFMTADRFATSGKLVPYAQTAISNATKEAAEKIVAQAFSDYTTATVGLSTGQTTTEAAQQAGAAYMLALSNATSLNSDTDSLYPDTKQLRYGQAGLRLTGETPIGLSWGTSYYYGHYKQPSFDKRKLKLYLDKRLAGTSTDDSDKFLQYDQLQVFGLEAETVKPLWFFGYIPLNFFKSIANFELDTRMEFAYNLTQDFDGTNPAIHNNSIAWVAGIQRDFWGINVNLQETGSYILKNDEIENGLAKTIDVDYNSDGTYSRNKIILVVKDTFMNENLTAEAQVIFGIENKEICIVPKVEYNISEGLTFTARGAWIYSDNENGEFYNFTADSTHHDKAFVQLAAKYIF